MNFLASLIVSIATALIGYLGRDLKEYLAKQKERAALQAAIQAAEAASVKPLIDAKTGEDVKNAAHSAMDGT